MAPAAQVLLGMSFILSMVSMTTGAAHPTSTPVIHGGVKMGVISHDCDDGMWNLDIDWDNSTDYEYVCQLEETEFEPQQQMDPVEECLKDEDIPRPLHRCMDTEIVYDNPPPRGGPHRPLWPVFGEYVYLPPQRWVHALEHGAAVFLYHPCAPPAEIRRLRALARRCLRKHVITPYRELDAIQPLAIVTYGCRLMMSTFDEEVAETFIKTTAMTAPESAVPRDGQFGWGLIHKAEIVSNLTDSVICPAGGKHKQFPDKDAMIAENMLLLP